MSAAARTTTNLAVSRPERAPDTTSSTIRGSRASAAASQRSASRASVSRASASRASASSEARMASLASELSAMRSRSSVQAARASRSRSSESVASISRARASRSAASVLSASAASASSEMASLQAVLGTATVPTGQASVVAALSSLTALTATATGTAASAVLASLADAASTLSALAAGDAATASSLSQQVSAATAPASAVSTTSATSQPTSAGLSGGQIAGIVVGVLAGALLLLLLGLCCWRRRRKDKSAVASIFPWRQSDQGRKVSDRYASTWDGAGGEKVQDDAPHTLWNVNLEHHGSAGRAYGPAMGYYPSEREADERSDGDNLTRGAPTRLDNYQEQDAGEGSNFLALGRSEASDDETSERSEASRRRQQNGQTSKLSNIPVRPSRQGVSMDVGPSPSQDRTSRSTAGRPSRGLSAIGGLMGGLVGSALSRRKQAPAAPRFPIEDDDDDQLFGDGNRNLESRSRTDGEDSDFYATLGNRPPRESSDLRYRQTPVPPPTRGPIKTSSRVERGWGGWGAALAGVARRASGGKYGAARSGSESQTQDWSDDEDEADSVTTVEVRSDSEEDEDDDEDEDKDEEDEGDDELRDLDERNTASKGRPAVYSSCATVGRNGSSRRASYDTAEQGSSRYASEDEYDEDARSDYTSPTAAVMARMSRDARGNKVAPSGKDRANPFARGSAEGDRYAARVPSLPSDFGDGDLGLVDEDEAPRSRRRRSSSEAHEREHARIMALGTAAAGPGALTGLAAKHRPSNGSTYSRGHYLEPSSSISSSAKPSRHSTFISSGTDLLGPAAIASRNSSQQRYNGAPARQGSRQAADDIVEEMEDSDHEEDNYSDVPLYHRELRNQLSTIFSESDAASAVLTDARSDRQERPDSGAASESSVAPLSIKKRSATYGSGPSGLPSPVSVGSDEVPPAYTSQDGGGRTSFNRRAASMEASLSRTRHSASPQHQLSQPAEPTGTSSGGILSGFTAGLRRLTSTLTLASRSPAIGSDHEQFVTERSTRRDSATLPSEDHERSTEGAAEEQRTSRLAVGQQSASGSSVPSIGHASFGVGRAKRGTSTRTANGTSSDDAIPSTPDSSAQSLTSSSRSGQGRLVQRGSLSAYLDVTLAASKRGHRGGPSSGSGQAASDLVSLANSSSQRTAGSGRTDAATLGSDEKRIVQRNGTVSTTGGVSEASRYGTREGDDAEEEEDNEEDYDSEVEQHGDGDEEEGKEEQDLAFDDNTEESGYRPAPPLQAAHYPSSSLGEAVLRQARREAGLEDQKDAAPGEALPTLPSDATLINDEKAGLALPTPPAKWRQSPRVETISKHAVVAALNLQRRAQHTDQPSQDFSLVSPSTSRASFEAPPPSYGLPDVRRGAMRNSRTLDGTWPTAPRVSLLQGHNGDEIGTGADFGEKGTLHRSMSQQGAPRRQGQGWLAY